MFHHFRSILCFLASSLSAAPASTSNAPTIHFDLNQPILLDGLVSDEPVDQVGGESEPLLPVQQQFDIPNGQFLPLRRTHYPISEEVQYPLFQPIYNESVEDERHRFLHWFEGAPRNVCFAYMSMYPNLRDHYRAEESEEIREDDSTNDDDSYDLNEDQGSDLTDDESVEMSECARWIYDMLNEVREAEIREQTPPSN